MKTSEEMAKNILIKRDEYKKKRSAAIKGSFAAAICLCICAVAAVFAVRGSGKISTAVENSTSPGETKTAENSGIYIEKIEAEIPTSSGFSTADTLGWVLYNGKVYTPSGYFLWHGEDSPHAWHGEELPLAGEYLGEGYIPSDDESFELTNVYAVKGYDSEFRICISADGKNISNVYEYLNGVTLKNGEDLYGSERLDLKDNYTEIQSVPWKHGALSECSNLEATQETVLKFVDALYTSPFVKDEDFDFNKTRCVALFFHMNNGSRVGVFLYENGYVDYISYANPNNVYVKITNPIFEEIFETAMK